jgi:predicted phosphodiesterase
MTNLFQVLSDIHLEFRKNVNNISQLISIPFDSKNINLLLAGDIGYPTDERFWTFIKSCSEYYRRVYFVTGNHEYYRQDDEMTMDQIDDIIKENVKKYDNVYFLHNSTIYDEENDATIIGSTLWSYIPHQWLYYIESTINDYNLIYTKTWKLTAPDSVKLYEKNVDWLKKAIKDAKGKIIIMTHHLPTFKLVHEKYVGSVINHAFASNLEYLTNENVKYWVCGHTHNKMTADIDTCKYVVNPFGYPSEDSKIDTNMMLELS